MPLWESKRRREARQAIETGDIRSYLELSLADDQLLRALADRMRLMPDEELWKAEYALELLVAKKDAEVVHVLPKPKRGYKVTMADAAFGAMAVNQLKSLLSEPDIASAFFGAIGGAAFGDLASKFIHSSKVKRAVDAYKRAIALLNEVKKILKSRESLGRIEPPSPGSNE